MAYRIGVEVTRIGLQDPDAVDETLDIAIRAGAVTPSQGIGRTLPGAGSDHRREHEPRGHPPR